MTAPAPADLWVFAYGSLMWRPGFAVAEARPARLRGYHRQFCIWSTRYRGTRERPGLVLGLDRGGSCRGLALRVPAAEAASVLAYLDEREMFDHVYSRRQLAVELLGPAADGTGPAHAIVPAATYVVDRANPAYAGELPPERIAAVIAHGAGETGSNRDYLHNTIGHLHALGVRDPMLARIAALVAAETAAEAPGGAAAAPSPDPVPPLGR